MFRNNMGCPDIASLKLEGRKRALNPLLGNLVNRGGAVPMVVVIGRNQLETVAVLTLRITLGLLHNLLCRGKGHSLALKLSHIAIL